MAPIHTPPTAARAALKLQQLQLLQVVQVVPHRRLPAL
jgi:hypothetical protein